MSKAPSPRADGLRAMREARYARSQEAQKVFAAAVAKPKRKPKADGRMNKIA